MATKQKEQPQMNQNEDDEVGGTILEYSQDIAEQERPPVLPVGEYLGKIARVERKDSQNTGKPFLRVGVAIPPESQPADFAEARGTDGNVNISGLVFGCEDNPVSRYAMQQFCKAIGAPMSNRIDYSEWIGLDVKVAVNHGKDLSGLPQPQVQRFMRP